MKKAAKVFLIIGMIGGGYLIFPIILGIFALRRLNRAKSSEDLKVWGILSIFFVSTLGGIFMLCVKDEELADNPNIEKNHVNKEKPINKDKVHTTRKQIIIDPAMRLRELKQLLDEGIIDEGTYKEKRKKYVEEL